MEPRPQSTRVFCPEISSPAVSMLVRSASLSSGLCARCSWTDLSSLCLERSIWGLELEFKCSGWAIPIFFSWSLQTVAPFFTREHNCRWYLASGHGDLGCPPHLRSLQWYRLDVGAEVSQLYLLSDFFGAPDLLQLDEWHPWFKTPVRWLTVGKIALLWNWAVYAVRKTRTFLKLSQHDQRNHRKGFLLFPFTHKVNPNLQRPEGTWHVQVIALGVIWKLFRQEIDNELDHGFADWLLAQHCVVLQHDHFFPDILSKLGDFCSQKSASLQWQAKYREVDHSSAAYETNIRRVPVKVSPQSPLTSPVTQYHGVPRDSATYYYDCMFALFFV